MGDMNDTEVRLYLTQYIKSVGKLGEQPDWYPVIRAARYLGVAPWELVNEATWLERAHIAMKAEEDANSSIRDELTKIARRDGGPKRWLSDWDLTERMKQHG